MTRDPSTFRATDDATLGDPLAEQQRFELPERIKAEWSQTGTADLAKSIERHPQLLHDRSILLNLALDEYKERRETLSDDDLRHYCQRFHRFGSSIEQSILRQLETQRYIDAHPELLELFGDPEWPEPGGTFGDFEVLEELGIGAIAHVYLCRQSEVGNRIVVVKATPYPSAEAAVLGRLDHPNIIPILSIGTVYERNLHFLCMPFCGRSTLSDVLDIVVERGIPRRGNAIRAAARQHTTEADRIAHNGRVPPKRRARCGTYVGGVVALAVEIAAALDHAHQQGIVHGDIKPSNILLTPEGRPLLMDFNLSVDYTNAVGLCGGTLPYMPPEHLRQLIDPDAKLKPAAEFDARPDVYSFGALVYELLTGAPPAELPRKWNDPVATARLALEQLETKSLSIRERNPQVTPRLERKILRCLQLDPANRPATIAEVQRELEDELRPIPTAARRVRNEPRKYAAIFGTILLIAASAGAYWASLPPLHEIEFQHGQQARAAGDLKGAVSHFALAIADAPDLIEPRFELASARLAIGEVELATKDFQYLAQQYKHPLSMAYTGYCFNRRGQPTAAVAWYESALESGIDTVAVNNNLGASYLITRGMKNQEEALQAAEVFLLIALDMDQSILTVRLNLVRLEVEKSVRNRDRSPIAAARHAEAVLAQAPNNPIVQTEIARWRELVIRRAEPGDEAVAEALKNIPETFPAMPPRGNERSLPADTYYIEP